MTPRGENLPISTTNAYFCGKPGSLSELQNERWMNPEQVDVEQERWDVYLDERGHRPSYFRSTYF